MSMPNSRWNRSTEAASCRSTATSSPVAANARTSSTCASSLSGSAPSRRVASATALWASPAASARNAPSRRTAPPSPWRRRRSPSSQASNPGLASTLIPSNSSRPRPGSSTAAADVPSSSTDTSSVEPLGSLSPTVAPLPTVSGSAEESAQLRQVPSKGVRRVLGLREQQRRKLLAGWRPLRERQVREDGPDLLAPGRRVHDPLPSDERRSEQLCDDGHPAILRRKYGTGKAAHTAPHTPAAYPAARAAERTGGHR